MQTSVFPKEADLIPFLICCCLISFLAWNVLLLSSNVPWTSIRETVLEGSKNRSDYIQLPRHLEPEGNQLLAKNSVEDECNYAEFVSSARAATSVYELQLRMRKIQAVDNNVDKSLLKEVFIDVQKFLLTTLNSNLADSQEIGNAEGLIRETAIASGIEKKAQMEGSLNERSIDGITVKMNTEDAMEEAKCETPGETNTKQSIRPETNLKAAVAFEETTAMLLSTSADQHEREFTEEGLLGGNWYKSRDEREEYPRNACGRKNVDNRATDDEDDPRHKFVAHLQIEKGGSKENLEYSEFEMKIEEPSEVEESLLENFPASVTQEGSNFRAKWSKQFGEKIITLEESPSESDVYSLQKKLIKKENCAASLENESQKMGFDGFEEGSTVNVEICSKEDDYLEQFGIIPEKEANCAEEKSIMQSEKNTTPPREEEKEKELGSSSDAELLRNSRNEPTISLVRSSVMGHGKEEEDLNAMIRRMIVTELRKHRNKERATLKRAYSDTESVLPRKKSSTKNRAGLFNLKGRTFFQDLLELEESLRRKSDEKPESESTGSRSDGNTVRRDDSANEAVNLSRNDDNACVTVAETSNDSEGRTNLSRVTCIADSNILLERKTNAPYLVDMKKERSTDAGKSWATHVPEYASKFTQTEHVYVIRAVRSCPLRKRRLPFQLQLQRFPLDREAVCSQTVFTNRDFTDYIFRKASDNLIYEKSKGSCSPSYIASPERFRWKYLTPNKVIRQDPLKCSE